MATNGWTMTRNTATGNYTLECKNSNFGAQEKKIQVNCGNRAMTGDLVVDVKAKSGSVSITGGAISPTVSILGSFFTISGSRTPSVSHSKGWVESTPTASSITINNSYTLMPKTSFTYLLENPDSEMIRINYNQILVFVKTNNYDFSAEYLHIRFNNANSSTFPSSWDVDISRSGTGDDEWPFDRGSVIFCEYNGSKYVWKVYNYKNNIVTTIATLSDNYIWLNLKASDNACDFLRCTMEYSYKAN